DGGFGGGDGPFGFQAVAGRRLVVLDFREHFGAYAAAGLDHEDVAFGRDEFGQGQVKAGLGRGGGPHRGAETGGRGSRAVHGYKKRSLAPGPVYRIGITFAQQHPVLNRDGGQFAGPHPHQGVTRRRRGTVPVQNAKTATLTLNGEQAYFGGVQEFLPALRR